MRLKLSPLFSVAPLLTASLLFWSQPVFADLLEQRLASTRTGDNLSCATCHRETRVITGGTAGLGDRRADLLSVSAVIDLVDEASILALSDPQDADGDGISGRPSWVLSLRDQRAVVGRFGWKASVGTLEDQIANALATDMGLENALLTYADHSCFADQPGCLVPNQNDGSGLLDALSKEVRALRESVKVDAGAGLSLFQQIGCAGCHQPRMNTPAKEPVWLFSDLLLHDMGPDLREDQRVGGAWHSEWRTAPLIGLSKRSSYLHDGRSKTIPSAIAAHAGEAEASAISFMALAPSDRLVLIEFLLSL